MSIFHPLSNRSLRSASMLSALASSLFVTLAVASLSSPSAFAQAAAPAARQLGTVKSISGSTITIATAAGAPITINLAPDATVLMLTPGTTDLKQATPSTADNIAVGDRVLASGRPGDSADILIASRVVLMKSSAIAARDSAEQADWQKRGVGGIVKSVNGDVIVISSGAKTINIQTTGGTIFRKYADDSIAFKDAQPSGLAQIHTGDQLTVRGAHSADNSAVTAEEVVTGSFADLSGAISAVDSTLGTVTLKDLATRKTVTVKVTANSDIRKLPVQAAAMFASRNNPGGGAPGGGGASGGGYSRPAGSPGAGGPGGGGARRAGADLSRMLSRLPTERLTDLKPGDAVMIVASQPNGSRPYTAITLLSGVEQILSSNAGGEAITLSPWNLGTPDAGGPGGGGGPR